MTELAVRFPWEHRVRELAFARGGMPATTYAVAMLLSTYAHATTGIAFPGNARMAQTLGMHTRTLERHLADLVALGLIERVSGGHHAGAPVRWRLSPDSIPLEVTPDRGAGCERSPVKATPDESVGCTASHPTQASVTPDADAAQTEQRSEHVSVLVSLEGDGDDDDRRAEFVVLRIGAANSPEELAAVRAADLWALERTYVAEAYEERTRYLEMPDFLR